MVLLIFVRFIIKKLDSGDQKVFKNIMLQLEVFNQYALLSLILLVFNSVKFLKIWEGLNLNLKLNKY